MSSDELLLAGAVGVGGYIAVRAYSWLVDAFLDLVLGPDKN